MITYGTSTDLKAFKAISGGNSYEQANNGSTIDYSSTGMNLIDGYLHNAADGYIWQIAAQGDGYTIQSKGNNTYLGSNSTYLSSIASYNASKCTWTISYDLYKGATRASNTEGGTNTNFPYFSYSATGKNCFVMNTDSGFSQAPPQFWKETTLSTTYYLTEPVAGTHNHLLQHRESVPATCTDNGNIEY